MFLAIRIILFNLKLISLVNLFHRITTISKITTSNKISKNHQINLTIKTIFSLELKIKLNPKTKIILISNSTSKKKEEIIIPKIITSSKRIITTFLLIISNKIIILTIQTSSKVKIFKIKLNNSTHNCVPSYIISYN